MDKNENDFIKEIGDSIIKNQETLNTVNEGRVKLVDNIYEEMKLIAKGEVINITKSLHEPFKTSGCIKVTGRRITFEKPEEFVKLAKQANNFHVWAKVDGTVVLDLSFEGLMV